MTTIPTYAASDFHIGQQVHILGQGRWYIGTVVNIGRQKVTAEYTTAAGKTWAKAVNVTKAVVHRGPGSEAIVSGSLMQPAEA